MEIGRPITPVEELHPVRVNRYLTPDSELIEPRKVTPCSKGASRPSKRHKRTSDDAMLEECQVCLRKCTPLVKYQFGQKFCSEECYEFI